MIKHIQSFSRKYLQGISSIVIWGIVIVSIVLYLFLAPFDHTKSIVYRVIIFILNLWVILLGLIIPYAIAAVLYQSIEANRRVEFLIKVVLIAASALFLIRLETPFPLIFYRFLMYISLMGFTVLAYIAHMRGKSKESVVYGGIVIYYLLFFMSDEFRAVVSGSTVFFSILNYGFAGLIVWGIYDTSLNRS